jgi:hypothetical protein
MRNQQASGSNSSNNGHATAAENLSKSERHPRGLWSFLTWSFFLSQVMTADRLLGNSAVSSQEGEDAAAGRAKRDAAAPSDPAVGEGRSSTAQSSEAIGYDDPAFAKAHSLSQTAALIDLAQRTGPLAPSKPSGTDIGEGSGGGGGGGGGGGDGGDGEGGGGDGGPVSGKPASGSPANPDSPGYSEPPIGWVPPVPGDSSPPGGPSSGGGGVSAGVDVNIGDIVDVGVNIGLPDVDLNAQVGVGNLLGFDVRVSADGIFVDAEIEVGQLLNIDTLGSSPVQIVESATALVGLDNLLDTDLPGVDTLLGSGEHLSQVKATLAEITGLSLVGGPSGSSGATLAQPLETLLSASPAPIHIVSELTSLGSNGLGGALSSGGVIDFPVPAGNPVAQIDQLFAGTRYTDYNLALQSSAKPTDTGTINGEPIDPTVATSLLGDGTVDRHDSANLPLDPAPFELALPLEEINSRGLPL